MHDARDTVHDVVHRDRLEDEIHLAGLDLRQIEDVVDQAEQMPPARQDVVQKADEARLDPAFELVPEDLREADNRVERGAQLMAHVGQELALRAVGLEDADVGLGELAAAAVELAGETLKLRQARAVLLVERRNLHAALAQGGDSGDHEVGAAEEQRQPAAGQSELMIETLDLPHGDEQQEVGRATSGHHRERGAAPGDEGRGGGVGQEPDEPEWRRVANQIDRPAGEADVADHPGDVETALRLGAPRPSL